MKEKSKYKAFYIIKAIFNTLLVVIIALYVSVILLQRLSGNKSVFGFRVFNVASASMIPVYKVNDVILVKDCDASKLKIGDDIAYKGTKNTLQGKIITHRIIKISNNKDKLTIITKGVSNEIEDPPIETNQILGKTVMKIPIISFINRAITTQLGFFTIIFCPIVILICMEIAETIIENKLEKKELVESSD